MQELWQERLLTSSQLQEQDEAVYPGAVYPGGRVSRSIGRRGFWHPHSFRSRMRPCIQEAVYPGALAGEASDILTASGAGWGHVSRSRVSRSRVSRSCVSRSCVSRSYGRRCSWHLHSFRSRMRPCIQELCIQELWQESLLTSSLLQEQDEAVYPWAVYPVAFALHVSWFTEASFQFFKSFFRAMYTGS
jgi:hypothetical protein